MEDATGRFFWPSAMMRLFLASSNGYTAYPTTDWKRINTKKKKLRQEKEEIKEGETKKEKKRKKKRKKKRRKKKKMMNTDAASGRREEGGGRGLGNLGVFLALDSDVQEGEEEMMLWRHFRRQLDFYLVIEDGLLVVIGACRITVCLHAFT